MTPTVCAWCAAAFEDDPHRPGPRRRWCGGACRRAGSVFRRTGHRTLTRAQRTALGF
jgi:hypothetical protein